METDPHKLWRIVGRNVHALREDAPDGHAPVVEVFLGGREAAVRIARVETLRDFPWALLVAETEDKSSTVAEPDELLVFVPHQYVQRVEVRYVRSDGPRVGFSHKVMDDSSPANDAEQ